jgi:methylmalonyl-CoA mutase C-terminal domain/subunit
MNDKPKPQRVLLAKIGLDGHDRGVKVIARGLRDAGFHVIYSGLWQQVESVVDAVVDEDVDWLGISILNGAHMTLVPQVLDALHARGVTNVGVIVGGIIAPSDQAKLKQLGVAEVFGPGVPMKVIVDFLSSHNPRTTSQEK